MVQYAFDELNSLVRNLPSPIDNKSLVVRYICALIAELAYYHIPQWELDNKKRAKLIPCDAYQTLVRSGVPVNVTILLRQNDLGRGFVVADRGVIAVGFVLNRLLFIGFRGTQFLFDWKINLRSRLVPVNARIVLRKPFIFSSISGRVHSGFGEESLRISARILDAIRDSNLGDIDHVFLAGHSLGGAVAAISENFIRIAPTSVCIFGSPRYSDLSAYANLPFGLPTQVRRFGDVVPTSPPKLFGFVDHPYEFATDGTAYADRSVSSSIVGDFLHLVQFFAKGREPHSMEAYRKEVGKAAGASAASQPLFHADKLKISNIGEP